MVDLFFRVALLLTLGRIFFSLYVCVYAHAYFYCAHAKYFQKVAFKRLTSSLYYFIINIVKSLFLLNFWFIFNKPHYKLLFVNN